MFHAFYVTEVDLETSLFIRERKLTEEFLYQLLVMGYGTKYRGFKAMGENI